MKNNTGWTRTKLLSLAFAAMAVLATGCSTTGGQSPAAEAKPTGKGAQLWADNCMRCHNVRPPNMYSDAQWEVVMMHMRTRATLTAEEYREILPFLKSAH